MAVSFVSYTILVYCTGVEQKREEGGTKRTSYPTPDQQVLQLAQLDQLAHEGGIEPVWKEIFPTPVQTPSRASL